MATYHLTIPMTEESVRALHVGDTVYLSGVIVTARDAAHKYLVETFIHTDHVPESERLLYRELCHLLQGGVIYHCGPVARYSPPADSAGPAGGGRWELVAAGPTTSIRAEPYEADVIAHFGVRGVIGKGGMGARMLQACQEHGAVYLHAVGGAATLIAGTVKEVLAVYKQDEFGMPEALWVARVEDFPVVVTMDSHGQSLHDEVEAASREVLARLIG